MRPAAPRVRRCCAAVASPHLVEPLELVERDADPELALEFLPHGDLVSLLGAPARHWLPALRAVVAALADLHEHGSAHGDVKARNVLFAADHSARLIDLTSARALDAPAVRATAAYSVPAGVGTTAAAADCFALAVLLYELTTARLPYGAERARPQLTSFALSDVPRTPRPRVCWPLPRRCSRPAAALPEGLSHFARCHRICQRPSGLSNNSVDPSHPQHDETIVPLRPGFRTGAEQPDPAVSAAPRVPRNWPLLLVGAALVVAVVVAFVWLPSRVEDERAATAAGRCSRRR